jgi:hypothetical protein
MQQISSWEVKTMEHQASLQCSHDQIPCLYSKPEWSTQINMINRYLNMYLFILLNRRKENKWQPDTSVESKIEIC